MAGLKTRLLLYRLATSLDRASRVVGKPPLLVSRMTDRASLQINRPRQELSSCSLVIVQVLQLHRRDGDQPPGCRAEQSAPGLGGQTGGHWQRQPWQGGGEEMGWRLLSLVPGQRSQFQHRRRPDQGLEDHRQAAEGRGDSGGGQAVPGQLLQEPAPAALPVQVQLPWPPGYSWSRRATTVTIMDGLTMGSAVLFGLNSSYSVATERTVWATPEVSIGRWKAGGRCEVRGRWKARGRW